MVRFGRSMSSQRRSQASENPQTMAVDNQSDQPIPLTVPVALEGGQQLLHLHLDQVLPDPVGIVPRRPFERLVALRYLLASRKLHDFA
jgi:hypothetical protein